MVNEIITPNGNKMAIYEYLNLLVREGVLKQWIKTKHDKEYIIKFN